MGGVLNTIFGNSEYERPESYNSQQPSSQRTNYSAYPTSSSTPQYNYERPVSYNPYPNYNITRLQQQTSTGYKRLVDVINPTEAIEESKVLLPGIKRLEVKNLILQYMPNVQIDDIYEVKNKFLTGLYELKKEEYKSRYQCSPREKILIHATARNKVDDIIKNNFDWRRVVRNKYGVGTSFTRDADYANCHCNRKNGPQRAFIITKVLIYRTHVGNGCTEIPPENVDTTVGKRNRQELVYVKYNDNEFLPVYIAYYESSDELISSSKYYEKKTNYNRRRPTYNYY